MAVADLFLVLLKFYASRRVAHQMGGGLAPLLVREVSDEDYQGEAETYWYAQAVLYALLAPQRSSMDLRRDELALAATARQIVPAPARPAAPPDAWPGGLRPRPEGLDERAVQMARKAILRARFEAKRYASIAQSGEERAQEIAGAAMVMFSRTWPKLANGLFLPTERHPNRMEAFRALAPAAAKERIASELDTRLRDGGSAEETRLQIGDRDANDKLVAEERSEPLISGFFVRRLETVFRLSNRVTIAEHLHRAHAFEPAAAEQAALLLKGWGQARKEPKATRDLLTKLGLLGREKRFDAAKAAERAAGVLVRQATRAAEAQPHEASADARLCDNLVHAERVRQLGVGNDDVPRTAERILEWLQTYRGAFRVPETQNIDDHTALTDGAPLLDEQDPDSLAILMLDVVGPDDLWKRMVTWAAEAYPFEDPEYAVRPIEEQRNQVAILMGMPELLLPNTLPPLRLLAEAGKRDGGHTKDRWALMSRLLNESVDALKASRERLEKTIAQGFEMALQAESGRE